MASPFSLARLERGAERKDYSISSTDGLDEKPSVTQIFSHNLAAVRLLKEVEAGRRWATAAEQAILVQYSGWGGIGNALEYEGWIKDEWKGRAEMLQELLTQDELESARESCQTSFYTPPWLINYIYEALQKMGFRGGKILEPAAGIGHFFGFMPGEMRRLSTMTGVEKDSISARIAAQLYQTHSILHQGYEKTSLPESFYDLVVGTVPFGDEILEDDRHNPYGFVLHDYFINKNLDLLRPGGLLAVITSTDTMDKKDDKARRIFNEKAELISAVRLPRIKIGGFYQDADALFLRRRRDEFVKLPEQEWLASKDTELPKVDNRGAVQEDCKGNPSTDWAYLNE